MSDSGSDGMREEMRGKTMASRDNCGVCGEPLVYGTEAVPARCAYCDQEYEALIYCPQGHYVCDSCHRHAALDVLREVLKSTTSTDPAGLLEKVMSHPAVPMHGPEHHAIVPGVIVAAAGNAGYALPAGAVEQAIERGARVPGGWCGFYGACGAALGVGIAVSVLTGATPLTGGPRGLANEATAFALGRIVDGYPRCCKRASRRAVAAAVEFLHERMGINLSEAAGVECRYTGRNRECPGTECVYYKTTG